jgi:hypothetical protein
MVDGDAERSARNVTFVPGKHVLSRPMFR